MHVFIFWLYRYGFRVDQENVENILLEKGLERMLGNRYFHVKLLRLIIILCGDRLQVDLREGVENEEDMVLEGGEGVDDFHVENHFAREGETAKMIHF